MKTKLISSEREYLKRCKYSSPESKLNWLASALELAQVKKKIICARAQIKQ